MSVPEAEKVCCIEISDTGYGIPEDELDSIFTPFYWSIAHKSTISGTGLGLAIVKRVITNHKGTFTVQPQEHKGTTFTVKLPYFRIIESEEILEERTKVVIIGGTTAGPKAAARLRRLDESLDLTIIEKADFLSYSACGLSYYMHDTAHSSREFMHKEVIGLWSPHRDR